MKANTTYYHSVVLLKIGMMKLKYDCFEQKMAYVVCQYYLQMLVELKDYFQLLKLTRFLHQHQWKIRENGLKIPHTGDGQLGEFLSLPSEQLGEFVPLQQQQPNVG